MRRRTALAGGWLATTALATAVCAIAVSLVTSDLTDPRRDSLAMAELRSIERSEGGSDPSRIERIDLGMTVDRMAPDDRTTRTVVSDGGVLVASCPAPVRLRSARPHPGVQVVVDDGLPGVIEVRFVHPTTTEVHRITCGPDGVQVDTTGPAQVAAPPVTASEGQPAAGASRDPEPTSSTAGPPDAEERPRGWWSRGDRRHNEPEADRTGRHRHDRHDDELERRHDGEPRDDGWGTSGDRHDGRAPAGSDRPGARGSDDRVRSGDADPDGAQGPRR